MHTLPTKQPFSFEHSLAFMRRFPAFATEAIVGDDRVTGAATVGTRAHAFTLLQKRGKLVLEVDDAAPVDAIAARVADLIGAADDVAPFYAIAKTDPHFAPVIRALHGLHHLRFLGGLAGATVYAILMQRTPMPRAVQLQSRFLARFGLVARAGGRDLHAWPELPVVAQIDEADIAAALRHPMKAQRIAGAVRGVLALGETFLREAPYAQARDALKKIDGIGPFSAAAILLRGLGRMDELPTLEWFERDGRAVYGRAWKPEAIAKRYGDQIGYWSYYLKIASPKITA